MLFPEGKTIYETTRGDTKFIVTSESNPYTKQDIIDTFSRLMVRDCGGVFDPNNQRLPHHPTRADIIRFKNFKSAFKIIWNGLSKKH